MRRLHYIPILSFLFIFTIIGPTIHLVATTDWEEILIADFNEEEKNTSASEKENDQKEYFNYFSTHLSYELTMNVTLQSKSILSKKTQVTKEIILPPPKDII